MSEISFDKQPIVSTLIRAKMNPSRIAFLRFILEGYDGLALLSTVNAHSGEIVVRFPPENAAEVEKLLKNLTGTCGICPPL